MSLHDSSRVNNSNINNKLVNTSSNSSRNTSSSNNNNTITSNNSLQSSERTLARNRQDNDGNSASAMSNPAFSNLMDDDAIDDQETINVGNLIMDLETSLEEQKNEDEQQANQTTCTTTTSTTAPNLLTSSTNFGAKASSSTGTTNAVSSNTPSTTGKAASKSSAKHSNNNITPSNNNSTAGASSSTGSSINSAVNSSTSNINNHLMTTRTVFKSSADERGELKMRITRETKPGKSEHKIVSSPNQQQKSPTSCNSSSSCFNQTNNPSASHVSNNCEETNMQQESISKPTQSSSSISSTKECGTSTSIGTITEPDCLGPCEPGTSVTLEGIVWQETDGGILVVNVTWRGKTYVGALLDCTKHDWAPPRLCDSPASDIDLKTHKGVRAKRIVTRSNGVGLDEKNLLQTTGKLRNGKGRRILTSNDLASSSSSSSCNKRQRETDKSIENIAVPAETNTSTSGGGSGGASSITNSENVCVPMNIDTTSTNNESISTSNISMEKAAPNSPMLIGCSEPNCSKKYRNMNGLLYHQAHAHADNDSNSAQDNNCSSSVRDKGKTFSKSEEDDQKDLMEESNDRESPINDGSTQTPQNVKLAQDSESSRQTPSPQLSLNANNKIGSTDQLFNSNNSSLLNPDQRPPPPSSQPLLPPLGLPVKIPEFERRNMSNMHQIISSMDHGRKSPLDSSKQHLSSYGHSSNNHHSSPKSSSNSSKQSLNPAPPPLPATTEEGMKPSGTSTGPPPAPHQTNCYFNPAYLANAFSPFALNPYFPQSPLPMYDPITPVTSTANAFHRFMSNMRAPPPPTDSPSRLLSPSVSKNLPFPPFKMEPGVLPGMPPNPQIPNASLPNMSPLTNPPLATSSPLLRMPSQGDPMMPTNSQPPPPPPPYPIPPGMSPVMGVPGPLNPLGPLGGPQVPSLVTDPNLAKQFQRRFD